MTYNPFSVVVVSFPFTDKNQTKKRPALVLSSLEHQKQTEHVTLLMITSAKNSMWPSDYSIHALSEAGLSTPSIIRQKIFTIDVRLIIKRVGTLSEKEIKEVRNRLKSHLNKSC